MKTCKLAYADFSINPLIIGTWQVDRNRFPHVNHKELVKCWESAYDLGLRSFDTAEIYAQGESEILLGKTLKGKRKNTIIATKVFPTHLNHDDLITACEKSLKRLQTDYIDLYQIHWPSGNFDTDIVLIQETMTALNLLKKQGKIRAIGISNFSKDEWEESDQFAKISSNQIPYSLFWRYAENNIQDYAHASNRHILSYSPLSQGLLSGKFTKDFRLPDKDIRNQHILFHDEHFRRALTAIQQLKIIATSKHISLAQLSLAWLLHQPATTAVCGVSKVQHVLELPAILDITLSDNELKMMNEISLTVTKHIGNKHNPWKF